MTGFLEWLLGLQNIRLGSDAPLSLQWNQDAPAWLVFTIAVAGTVLIAWIYRRERTTRPRRIVLCTVRLALFAIALAAFCKPTLVLQQNRVEPSFVALLIDASASMATRDNYVDEIEHDPARAVARGAGLDPGELANHSRLELLQAALTRDDAAPIRSLLSRNGVQVVGFSNAVEPLAFASDDSAVSTIVDVVSQLRPDGFATDIAGAISRVLERSEGRRLAAIVLVGDGRATKGIDLRDAAELAAGRQIPIHAVPIGSQVSPIDVEVGPLRAAQSAFLHDIITIEAQVIAHGLSTNATVELKLLDISQAPDGEVVARESVTIAPDAGPIRVELRTRPTRTGNIPFRVEAAPLPHERLLDNNADRIDVTVTDDRVRILYVEAYPRYEYRYLKNALLREKSVDVSVLLLEADEQFVQEGTIPIRRFPDTPEELNRYDVILFGDVDPRGGWISQAQMLMMLDFVANEGGGFGLIAGERATPHRFVGTPLERLIPVVIDPASTEVGRARDAALTTGFPVRLTRDGYSSRLFRFAPTVAENEKLIDALPDLYWIARTLGPKAGATVLAEHPTLLNPRGPGGMPLFVLGQYGAGKLFFQASDDTWRWRRHTGELLHDSFWVQVGRELMRPARMLLDRKFIVRTDRRTYPYGSAVHVQAEVFDAQALRDHPESFDVALFQEDDMTASMSTPTPPSSDRPSGTARGSRTLLARLPLTRVSPDSNLFEGSAVPPQPGRFALEPAEAPWRRTELSQIAQRGAVRFRVERPNLEARQPAADRPAMERAAAATGGRVIELDRLEEDFAAIPDRSLQVPDDVVEPLWDTKLIFGLFVLMISMEWLMRKTFGLL